MVKIFGSHSAIKGLHSHLKNLDSTSMDCFERQILIFGREKSSHIAKPVQLGDNCSQNFIWGGILLDIWSEI